MALPSDSLEAVESADCSMALLKSKCNGSDVIINATQATVLKRDKRSAFRHDSTPMSTDLPRACDTSTSARVGELSTCEKKFDEARTAVDTALTSRWRMVLIVRAVDSRQGEEWNRKALRTAAPRPYP